MRLLAPVAQVVADDEAAHAVAEKVEAGLGVVAVGGDGVEPAAQLAGALHEVAAPVVGEDRVAETGRPEAPLEAGPVEKLDEVCVLGESEGARQHGVRAHEGAGPELVTALGEGELPGQAQVVVAEGVAEVEPGHGPVGPDELAAEEPGYDDEGRGHAAVAERADETRVQGPTPAGQQPSAHRPGDDPGEGPGDERPHAACASRPRQRVLLSVRPHSDCSPFASFASSSAPG
jgi:hypothetical protein